MKILLTLGLLSFSIVNSLQSQAPAPAIKQNKTFAIVGAIIHNGKGQVIENANMFFEKGVITKISFENPNPNVEIIQAKNKHIYPGFILPNTHLGLVEIEAVRATADFEEKGFLNPHIRSLIAYNTESELIPTFRFNGVLLAQISPVTTEGIAGTSSVVHLDAWNWEDAFVKADNAIHLYMPATPIENSDINAEEFKKAMLAYRSKINIISQFFEDAFAYYQTSQDTLAPNLKLEAIKGLFNGTKKIFIHCEELQGIHTALNFCKKTNVKNIVLVTNDVVLEIIDELKTNSIAVILNGVHKLPSNIDDRIDLPFSAPVTLFKSGVLVGITQHKNHIANGRNLPFLAGHTVGFGLNKEEALSLITSNNAKILGVDNQYGSIEEGKSATFIISEGDALDMKTNKIIHAFINGRKIDLEAKQQRLYNKYKNKYLQEGQMKK